MPKQNAMRSLTSSKEQDMPHQQILIVDDEHTARFAIDFALRSAGYATAQAHNGKEALTLLREKASSSQPFDLVIADIQMPDMNGIELIDAMHHENIHAPVVVITAFGDKQTLVELVRRRCDYYLDKPFSPQDLLAAVEKVLDRAQKTQQAPAQIQQLVFSETLNLVSQIAPKIAHEISNPAQIIQGYAELLMNNDALDPNAKKLLANIREAVKTIVKLNRNLMELTRPCEMQMSVFLPHEPLEKAIDFLTGAGVIKNCTVLRHYASDVPRIAGDFMQLYQVFLNLLLNASFAMRKSEKKVLSVATSHSPDANMVTILVSDTGCGIAPEHLEKIFDSFFTTRASEGGTGLGLAVVKQIVENHRGTVQVHSQPAEGATFTICLPTDTTMKGGSI